MAALFLRREPPGEGSRRALLSALPSLAAPTFVALATRLGPPLFSTSLGDCLFAGGCLLAAGSLATLGRSFAVLPARRALVTRGPYRLVRHPAYLGELLATLGLALQRPTLATAALLIRIHHEETLLSGDPAWRHYAEKVRWRLIPALW